MKTLTIKCLALETLPRLLSQRQSPLYPPGEGPSHQNTPCRQCYILMQARGNKHEPVSLCLKIKEQGFTTSLIHLLNKYWLVPVLEQVLFYTQGRKNKEDRVLEREAPSLVGMIVDQSYGQVAWGLHTGACMIQFPASDGLGFNFWFSH